MPKKSPNALIYSGFYTHTHNFSVPWPAANQITVFKNWPPFPNRRTFEKPSPTTPLLPTKKKRKNIKMYNLMINNWPSGKITAYLFMPLFPLGWCYCERNWRYFFPRWLKAALQSSTEGKKFLFNLQPPPPSIFFPNIEEIERADIETQLESASNLASSRVQFSCQFSFPANSDWKRLI